MEEEVGRVDGVGVVRGGRCEICKLKLAKRQLERDAAEGEKKSGGKREEANRCAKKARRCAFVQRGRVTVV